MNNNLINNISQTNNLSNTAICTVLDRTREVNYNGNNIMITEYRCSSCDNIFHLDKECTFCPVCGIKHTEHEDISV